MSQREDSEKFEMPSPWHEGSVDRSETHIKVRYGGILEDDPPGVDIALLGPGAGRGPDCRFLPTPGLAPTPPKSSSSVQPPAYKW